ncbi:2,3-diaminopropionate biosynthesis protein SbnA [Echinicola pacifica]|uniref:2,3-diaminopropionate biosynthesis protein SbnA n=1 Tax=Echinicola pacifica TaxID=346377 RepID=A0A918Q2G1_9BACT|nr:2,3-diaminopropionate biosynthesis protein SbnA [Echinicola pacifica]GGZ31350.1 2,3-diaminopropionate biosynthesis protein SbnA [Echinicola pacifica]
MITTANVSSVANNIVGTIGETPLVRLDKLFPSSHASFYGKLEAANPSGSLKDRTSIFIVKRALEEGEISRGHTIIESSSGNMALGLAQACIHYGLKLIVVVDPNLNAHTEKLLKAYGAQIEYVKTPAEEGGFLAARLNRVQELLKDIPNSFWTNQYGNKNNPLAHHKTIDEIMRDLSGAVDYLFVSTSTCGTLMGYADYIAENHHRTKVIAVDALGSVLFGGRPAPRLIPGHGAGVQSQFLDSDKIEGHIKVSDLDCIKGCWSLLKKEGILCGGSTGGVVAAISRYIRHIPDGSNCVFLLADKGERYLDTIYNPDWVLTNFPESKALLKTKVGW